MAVSNPLPKSFFWGFACVFETRTSASTIILPLLKFLSSSHSLHAFTNQISSLDYGPGLLASAKFDTLTYLAQVQEAMLLSLVESSL